MAFRTFQFCIVFTIGFWIGPALVYAVATAGAGITSTLSLLVSDPQDVVTPRGQPASLHCRVDNSLAGGYRVQWLYTPSGSSETILLTNDTWRTVMNNGTLHMKKVPGKKIGNLDGEYRCLVKNKIGSILSRPAKFQVATIARSFNIQPEDKDIESGQPLFLPCAIQSTPSAVVHWIRDGNPLPQNIRYVSLPSGGLLITTIQPSDAGSYRCTAVNEMMKSKNIRDSDEAKVTVISTASSIKAPKFLPVQEKYNITAELGTDLQLYCSAIGWPKPNIRWTYSAKVPLGNSSVLLLRNLTLEHNGTYTCTAHNSIGRISQDYNVEIVQTPYFTRTPISQYFPSAKTVRVDCLAEGIPTPEITWLKDGSPVELGGRINYKKSQNAEKMLVLSHTFTTDSGIYQCIATNKVGQVWSAAQLVANVSDNRPPPPQNVRCRPYDSTSICLQWDPPPNINISAYSVHSFHAGLGPDLVTNRTYHLAQRLHPNTNYSFYIRVYSRVASDHSKNITCQTVVTGSRTVNVTALSSTILRIEWNTLSSDTPCGGVAEYKLQWRKKGDGYNLSENVRNNYHIIRGLIPNENYEMRVQTSLTEDEELPWTNFTMPNINTQSSTQRSLLNETEIKHSNRVLSPVLLEAVPSSSRSISLSWKDPRAPEEKLAGYYMICFAEVKTQQSCENGPNIIKSTSTKYEIKGLKPYTMYEFRVRAHNLDGHYGQYSQSIECRTPEDVPSPVGDLMWKTENSTSVCLRWRVPNHHNGILKHYVVSYTSDQNLSFEQWPSITLPVHKISSQGCWRPSADTVSIHLQPLIEGKKYMVIVRAGTRVGLSKPSEAKTVTILNQGIKIPDLNKTGPPTSDNRDGMPHDQRLGIIVGVIIAIFCVIFCISCMIFRRRCIKSRGLDRVRVANPQTTNGQTHQPQAVSTVPNLSCQPVTVERPCQDAEVHELQCLVGRDGATTHIPPLVHSHLDTKGGVRYPNGQVNGLKYLPLSNGNIPNGNVHITENPQYEPYECNGHFNSTSESRQLLSADAERSGNSDDTLNSTQLTSLDDTLTLSTARTISPVIGPNG